MNAGEDDGRDGTLMKKRALLVGVDNYEFLGNLEFSRADAEGFADALVRFCGFEEDWIHLLTCGFHGAAKALSRSVERALDDLTQEKDLDLLVFGFWGHGFRPSADKCFLCGLDTAADDLERSAIHLDLVKARLCQAGARDTVIVLDCCQNRPTSRDRSGGIGVLEAGVTESLSGMAREISAVSSGSSQTRTVGVIMACSEGQRAYEWPDRRHGIFTGHLLEGFELGHQSMAGLTTHLSRKVPSTARRLWRLEQVPFCEIKGSKTDIVIGEGSEGKQRRGAKASAVSGEGGEGDKVLRKEEGDWGQGGQGRVGGGESKKAISLLRIAYRTGEKESFQRYVKEVCEGARTEEDWGFLLKIYDEEIREEEYRELLGRGMIECFRADDFGTRWGVSAARVWMGLGKENEAQGILEEVLRRKPEDEEAGGMLEEIFRRKKEGKIPAGCRIKPGSEAERDTNSGWAKEVIHETSGVELVYVPRGEFTMGSPAGEAGRYDDEGPQRSVTIRGFYLGKVEVTQEQYERVMGKNPSHFKGSQRPVEQVSWYDAKGYCERVGMRLPSEAEWEYACRAGTQTRYCYGDDEIRLGEYAWYDENSGEETHVVGLYERLRGVVRGETGKTTHPVGQKRPNGWGLYDMHGNVWEWCEDVWHDSYAGAPSDGRAWMEGGDSGKRVLRGGSWSWPRLAQRCRSANRNWDIPAHGSFDVGFRVALGLPES